MGRGNLFVSSLSLSLSLSLLFKSGFNTTSCFVFILFSFRCRNILLGTSGYDIIPHAAPAGQNSFKQFAAAQTYVRMQGSISPESPYMAHTYCVVAFSHRRNRRPMVIAFLGFPTRTGHLKWFSVRC
ncbi:hypothetical protein LX36DRAFT_652099 [Colletotrichum falcatum]|nr:hypothetical protein LX36DRAFT_652099 [Colletotrichum falcatum]